MSTKEEHLKEIERDEERECREFAGVRVDALIEQLAEARAERDAALAERDAVHHQLDELEGKFDAKLSERIEAIRSVPQPSPAPVVGGVTEAMLDEMWKHIPWSKEHLALSIFDAARAAIRAQKPQAVDVEAIREVARDLRHLDMSPVSVALLRAIGDVPPEATSAPQREAPTFDLVRWIEDQREFSLAAFGPGARTEGNLAHIAKELDEIRQDPSSLTERIDVVILALDGAWRAGFEPREIADALRAKLEVNKARTWPDWRTMREDQAIEHVRTSAPQAETFQAPSTITMGNVRCEPPAPAEAEGPFFSRQGCYIEEREWRFGDGWFRWLSLFRRPRIHRSLDIEFSAEVGPEKGSWKGGTIGHSTDIAKGESCESAFRRYCEREHRSREGSYRLRFVGKAAEGEEVTR